MADCPARWHEHVEITRTSRLVLSARWNDCALTVQAGLRVDGTVLPEYLAANCVAEAAKDLGVADDRVRLALMEAAVRQGQKVADWNVCAAIAARAAGLDEAAFLTKGRSAEVEKRVRSSTAAFHALLVTQRPTFVLDSDIGDRAVFSGFWRLEPLVGAIESMLADATAYESWKAHFGDPPPR